MTMMTDDSLMGIRREKPEEPRQIKLRLPMDQVMKLHRLRILRGKPISEFVADALDSFFEEERTRREAVVRVR
jgi:hypothetical protein